MKKLLLCLPILMLMACGGSVSSDIWKVAEDICANRGGVSYVFTPIVDTKFNVCCKNGFDITVRTIGK